MTTIIATFKAHWLREIRSGYKLEEIRKSIPRAELPIRVLCCESGTGGQIPCEFIMDSYHTETLSGIMARMPTDFNIRPWNCVGQFRVSWETLQDYMNHKELKPIFFWHISQLIDYTKTKGYRVRNISEFVLKRPPQSWQYIDT